jgi:hypothetical protein
MQVGQANQSVSVTAESPLVDTSTASIGEVLGNRTILDLRTKDSMVLVMATLVPGVTFTPQTIAYIRPFDTGSPSQMSANGVRQGNNAFMLDGAPDMQGQQIAYSPPQAIVQQLKVWTGTFDASYGVFPGAAVNMTLKTGTNDLHGQVNYFMQNPALNANNYFRVASGKPDMRIHRMSASLVGPVVIPKVYNGHNKTFFTAAYEWIYSFDPSPWVVEAVPTQAERNGDFSSLLALGPSYQIYDPFSTTPAGGGRFSRQPVPNNIIPASQINPVSANIAKLWICPTSRGPRTIPIITPWARTLRTLITMRLYASTKTCPTRNVSSSARTSPSSSGRKTSARAVPMAITSIASTAASRSTTFTYSRPVPLWTRTLR